MRTEDTNAKNQRLFNALYAPDLYTRHFNGHLDRINVIQGDGATRREWNFETLADIDDKDTGLRAAVVIDRATGHAIVMYKGMDRPFMDEGNGRLAFLKDAKTAVQSWVRDGENQQTDGAEQLYLDTLNNPDVKSVEVIGFSLGTLHANYVVAKYGAKGTVLGDLGMSKGTLERVFNERARGENMHMDNTPHFDPPAAIRRDMEQNMTVLRLKADPIPLLFRDGPSRGRIIDLDEGRYPDAKGLTHLASIYRDSARGYSEQQDRAQSRAYAPMIEKPAPPPPQMHSPAIS